MLMRKTLLKEIKVAGEGMVDDKAKDWRRVMGMEHRWRD